MQADFLTLREAAGPVLPWLIIHGAMSVLAAEEGKAALAAWRRIEAEAQAELASGHRATVALEWDSKPWERARFLAIPQAFIDEWQPRGGSEMALIDQMTQAHGTYLFWMTRLHILSVTERKRVDRALKREGRWEPPRVDAAGCPLAGTRLNQDVKLLRKLFIVGRMLLTTVDLTQVSAGGRARLLTSRRDAFVEFRA